MSKAAQSQVARSDPGGSNQNADVDAANGELGPEDIWKEPLERLLARLRATPAGLGSAEARSRLTTFGPNDAATVKRSPLWLQFLGRFRNPLVIILLVASGLSAATGDAASFLIVVTIVTISITLDFVQEVRAQNAVEALRRSVAVQANVRREGQCVLMPIDRLVPGDVVELIAGDLVPADSRLLESRDLFINQALLTGEPYPAEKQASDSAVGAENPAGASNAVFAGTSVISGTATIVVCRTGGRTALGHLATSLAEKPPATAFAIGIRRFGMLIMYLTVSMVLFVLVVNISFHRPVLESLMFALALAVGLTPELLPMIVTVTLARSAMDLSRRKVIVKRLTAIHDLGAMNVLCTDKTGTLTEATIKLVHAIDGRGAESAARLCLCLHQQPVRKRHEEPARRRHSHRPAVRHGGLEQDRRGAVRFRTAARLRPGRARRQTPSDRQGCAGGSAATVKTIRERGRRGAAARRRDAPHLRGDARRARCAGVTAPSASPAAWWMRATPPPRSPTRASLSSPALPSSSILRRQAPGRRSTQWRRRALP